jgi:hypothetical protein
MNSLHEIKVLPYEPERQQLRMDTVKDLLPYEPERQ